MFQERIFKPAKEHFSGMLQSDFQRLHFRKWCVMIKNTTPCAKKKPQNQAQKDSESTQEKEEDRNASENYTKKHIRQRISCRSKAIREKTADR